MAFLLGLRHGLDADHIAAVDAIGRLNLLAGRPRLARLAGVLFSAGHASVVLVAALAVALLGELHLPRWLDRTGASISIVLLLAMGLMNLRAAFRDGTPVAGLRARLIRTDALGATPVGGWLVGALFALSLDTLTQAAWFGVSGQRADASFAVVSLALVFGAGMALTDGLNGWWIARLVDGDAASRRAARRNASLVVALVALAAAAMGVLRIAFEDLDRGLDAAAWVVGLATAVAAWIGLALAQRAVRRSRARAAPERTAGA